MNTIIKTSVLIAVMACLSGFFACNEKQTQTDSEPARAETKQEKGGSLEIDKDKLKIEGKNGGKLEIDKDGVEIKGADKKE